MAKEQQRYTQFLMSHASFFHAESQRDSVQNRTVKNINSNKFQLFYEYLIDMNDEWTMWQMRFFCLSYVWFSRIFFFGHIIHMIK